MHVLEREALGAEMKGSDARILQRPVGPFATRKFGLTE